MSKRSTIKRPKSGKKMRESVPPHGGKMKREKASG